MKFSNPFTNNVALSSAAKCMKSMTLNRSQPSSPIENRINTVPPCADVIGPHVTSSKCVPGSLSNDRDWRGTSARFSRSHCIPFSSTEPTAGFSERKWRAIQFCMSCPRTRQRQRRPGSCRARTRDDGDYNSHVNLEWAVYARWFYSSAMKKEAIDGDADEMARVHVELALFPPLHSDHINATILSVSSGIGSAVVLTFRTEAHEHLATHSGVARHSVARTRRVPKEFRRQLVHPITHDRVRTITYTVRGPSQGGRVFH